MRKSVMAVVLVVLFAPSAAWPQAKSQNSGVYDELNLFGEAFERIRHDAVDPVADSRLVDTAITGMLASLDPHAAYLSETEYKALQSKSPNESASTGLVVTLEKGQVKVVAPRDGSPAAAADIKPGDLIFMIDKKPIYDLTLSEVEQKLRGPVDSEVSLLLRRGTSAPITVKLKRVAANFPSVTHRLEASDIGYIRLAGFDASTAGDLAAAVSDLRAQAGNKLVGFILDLRNNPGGDFNAAVAAADAFIDKGDITVVKNRKTDDVKRIAATPGDLAKGQPIVALVNGGTAGEAELVAGALEDNKRAILLGSKTFGESAIETLIPLNGNGAIRLTTARFTTPEGHAIQGKGLEPDIAVSPLKLEKVAEADRLREADLRGALKNPDTPPKAAGAPAADAKTPEKPASGKPAAATTPKTVAATVASGDIGTTSDEQLSEAIDVLRGLAVVSGQAAAR
ncbi:MAG TPA: S41 family peptidase [Stellaceae bacterium]|nr:S41 family peptidase [Stellaceae bacterium]